MKGKWDIPLGCGIPGIQDSRLKTCIEEDDIYAGFYVITFKGGRNQSGTLKRNKRCQPQESQFPSTVSINKVGLQSPGCRDIDLHCESLFLDFAYRYYM